MSKNLSKYFLIAILILLPAMVSAHQPRIPTGADIVVTDPEVSKAYYTKLQGQANFYYITAEQPFTLYVNILVPDLPDQKTDFTVAVVKDGEYPPVAFLDGRTFTWTKFFEPFGYDNYLKGPEYKAEAAPGKYQIIVSNTNNDSKYALAIGEKEAFDFKEGMNAINLIPQIKKDFFNESPDSFILSPIGYGYIIVIFILAFAIGLAYRFFLTKSAQSETRRAKNNIGTPDRWIRIGLGILLLILAITTTWNPFLIFFAGFAFFEAIFSWCGFYAAIGKNTCPRK